MSTASTAVKIRSKMTEITYSQPILLSWEGAQQELSQLCVVWVTQSQDCEGSVGFALASPMSLACSHSFCECLQDVVNGVEGGGKNKAKRV